MLAVLSTATTRAYAAVCSTLARLAITRDDSYGQELAFHVLRLLLCVALVLPHVLIFADLPHSLSQV